MIIASDGPAVTIPEITVTEYVLRHAARLADKPALIDGPSGRALTYGQLADGIRRVATGLAQHGFRRGVARRQQHHHQSSVYRRRARQAVDRLRRANYRDRSRFPGQG